MTNFAGKWDVTLASPIGSMAVVFDITEVDGKISGIAHSDAESVPFDEVVAEGDHLTWKLAVTTPMKLTLKFDIAFDGDTLNGTSKAGMLPSAKVNGVRAAAE